MSAEAAEGAVATAREVLEQLTKIGFANIQDYVRIGSDGDPVLDFENLTRDQAAALSRGDRVGIATVNHTDARGFSPMMPIGIPERRSWSAGPTPGGAR